MRLEAQGEMAASTSLISSSHALCLSSFDDLFRTLQNPSRDLAGPELSSVAQNEYGRYKVWAGNVGAAHLGRAYRLSLDYRLKDTSFYRDRVKELLVDLQMTIRRIISILNGESIPFELIPDTSESRVEELSPPKNLSDESSDEFSDSEASESGGNIGASLREMRKKVESLARKPSIRSREPDASGSAQEETEISVQPTEIRQASMAIRDIVSSLYKLAMVIRRPMPSDRHTKSTKINVQHFAEFDQRYVYDKFPQADPELAARLGRGITRRRQLLKYRELHNEQMKVGSVSEPSIPADLNLDFLRDTTSKVSSSRLMPSTKATTFIPTTPLIMDEVQSVADTASSYNSVSSVHEVINIPARPRGPDGDELEEFECPYCHVLCEIKSSNTWKHHVLRDLEPYMCTFLQCQKAHQMYASRPDWHSHELEHRIEWFCNTKGHSPFRIRDDFATHMIGWHGFAKSSDQTTLLLDSFRRPLVVDNSSCPLCKTTTKNLEGHVARHLTQLALFAIPQLHYADERSDLESTASRDVQVRSSDSGQSGFENRFEDSEAGRSENTYLARNIDNLQDMGTVHLRIISEIQSIRAKVFAKGCEVNKNLLEASLVGPWGKEGATVKFKFRLLFPDDYPEQPPTFSIDKTSLISDPDLQVLERGVERIAKEWASSRLGSLEAIVGFLVGEYADGKRTFEDRVRSASSAPGIGKNVYSDAQSQMPANDIGRGGSISNESIPNNPVHPFNQPPSKEESSQSSEVYDLVTGYRATPGQVYHRRLSDIDEDDGSTRSSSTSAAVSSTLQEYQQSHSLNLGAGDDLMSAKSASEESKDSLDAFAQHQNSSNRDSGTVPPLPPCPRPTYSAGHDDWLTLPSCPALDICPSCFTAIIAPTEFCSQFVPAARALDIEVRCDLGSSNWFRIAWLLTRQQNLQDLGMFIGLANNTHTTSPCPGKSEAIREWHSILDPSTNTLVGNFDVCQACARNIEVLLPVLKGIFVSKTVLPPSWSNNSSRVCDMRLDGPWFVRYFDAFESTANGSVIVRLTPDVTQLVSLIRRLHTLQPCRRDKELLQQKWYFITQLPEFTVCEECFTFEVIPGREEHKAIPMLFGEEPRIVPNASCQLYSPRMREIFQTAVKEDDYKQLAYKARERRAAEVAFKQRFDESLGLAKDQDNFINKKDQTKNDSKLIKLSQKWLEVQ